MSRRKRVRTASITTAPESPSQELSRRQRRYAGMAIIFVASFAAAALLHDYPAAALSPCGVAIVTLVLAVIGANVRLPRRHAAPGRVVNAQPRLHSSRTERPPDR